MATKYFSCVLAGALLSTACSAANPTSGDRGKGTWTANSGSGGTGTIVAGTGATGGNDFGNNNGGPLVTTPPPTPVAGTGQPMSMLSSRDPVFIDQTGADNPAGASAADVGKLKMGSGSPGMLKFLYPYTGTVFPRGMGAPMLMWSGADMVDAVLLHFGAKSFDYKGVLKPTAAGQLTIPQDVWDKAGKQTNGKGDTFTLELTTITKGAVTGPVVSNFEVAQATIKGSIYYNSYNSKMNPLSGGSVLRIPNGTGTAAEFVSTGCNGCHSVSADGSRLVSQFAGGGGQTFQLTVGGPANPPGTMAGPRGNFGAFYPDGSKYIATSTAVDVARTFMTQGFGAPPDATLYDASTGQVVMNKGIPTGALMPMISADGTHFAFNDFAIGNAHGLAIMKYDVKSDTASEYKMLMQETGNMRPGWPFILPDNAGVVFTRTDGNDFSGNGAGIDGAGGLAPPGGGLPGVGGATAPFSELNIVDVATGTVTVLAKAMGYDTPADAAAMKTYLPFGADELHHNYFPTVSPVAAGGYFWVFFDSLRHYGNLGQGRQLWGAAVDIQSSGSYKLDPSHPAFYLPGQEFGTGNHRAFAALDPCKKDGDKCNSGIDCCGGFCYFDAPEELVDQVGSCSPKKNMCSKRDERCTNDADCCPPDPGKPSITCIAGFCAEVPVLN